MGLSWRQHAWDSISTLSQSFPSREVEGPGDLRWSRQDEGLRYKHVGLTLLCPPGLAGPIKGYEEFPAENVLRFASENV